MNPVRSCSVTGDAHPTINATQTVITTASLESYSIIFLPRYLVGSPRPAAALRRIAAMFPLNSPSAQLIAATVPTALSSPGLWTPRAVSLWSPHTVRIFPLRFKFPSARQRKNRSGVISRSVFIRLPGIYGQRSDTTPSLHKFGIGL